METHISEQLEALARDTAATVHATVRRWWIDAKDRHLLHVEAERTFVGARPVVVHFSVPLEKKKEPAPAGQPKMEVGEVSIPSGPVRERPVTRSVTRRSAPKKPGTPRKVSAAKRRRTVCSGSERSARKKPGAQTKASATKQRDTARSGSEHLARKKATTSERAPTVKKPQRNRSRVR